MGILLGIPIFVACWLLPSFIVFRSPRAAGWPKARWVIACLLSPAVPGLLVALGVAVAVYFGGYQRDAKAVLFGPEAIAWAVANISALVLPWLVLAMFKKYHRAAVPPSPSNIQPKDTTA